MGLDAETAGQGDVIQLGPYKVHALELLGFGLRQIQAPSAELENLVLGVVANHKDHRNLVASSRPKALNSVGRRSFAEQRQHRALWPGELGADRYTQPPAERPA